MAEYYLEAPLEESEERSKEFLELYNKCVQI
jgi:hypothetical protein